MARNSGSGYAPTWDTPSMIIMSTSGGRKRRSISVKWNLEIKENVVVFVCTKMNIIVLFLGPPAQSRRREN